MSECTRCGVHTRREAFNHPALEEYRDTNGVVWLCDNCIADFKKFLRQALEMSQVQSQSVTLE